VGAATVSSSTSFHRLRIDRIRDPTIPGGRPSSGGRPSGVLVVIVNQLIDPLPPGDEQPVGIRVGLVIIFKL